MRYLFGLFFALFLAVSVPAVASAQSAGDCNGVSLQRYEWQSQSYVPVRCVPFGRATVSLSEFAYQGYSSISLFPSAGYAVRATFSVTPAIVSSGGGLVRLAADSPTMIGVVPSPSNPNPFVVVSGANGTVSFDVYPLFFIPFSLP